MKNKELLAMADLAPTDEIMKMAAKDVPHEEKFYSRRSRYKHEVFVRAKVQGKFLVVAFFLAAHLRADGRKPVYTLFMEKDTDYFITYDYIFEKWRQATLERLEWPNCSYYRKFYINHADRLLIAQFLNKNDGTYVDIYRYQLDIRYKQLKMRHKKETDPWDEVMEKVRPLPRDWERWVTKTAVTHHFIFYKYAKNVSEGYCSRCAKMVPISKPRHNKMGKCPRCGREIQFKSVGKAGRISTKREPAYLLQPFDDKFIIREFQVSQSYMRGLYETPEVCSHEVRRVIIDDKFNVQIFYYGVYKQQDLRWIRQNTERGWGYSWYYNSYEGQVYRRTLPYLNRHILAKTGLYEYLNKIRSADPEAYLKRLKTDSYLEQLSKAKLFHLAHDVIRGKGIEITAATSLKKMLGIDDSRMKRLKNKDGGVDYLNWLREEKRRNCMIPDQIIDFFIGNGVKPGELRFVNDRMSVIQIYNYLVRQQEQCGQSIKQLITTWKDYLSMAEKLNMNTKDSIIYRASKLVQRHNEAVLLLEQKNFEDQEAEFSKKFPNVATVYREIKEKYEYLEDETYAVLVPDGIRDVMVEGRKLHHCVGTEERYFDRISRQETYILFLRRQENLQEAYYTLEVEPGGTIRQKRTEYDRQKDDIKEAGAFLKKWQNIVSARLAQKDYQMAAKSKKMRSLELSEMRRNKVIISGGFLAGRLLADVLEEDLMEMPQRKEAA